MIPDNKKYRIGFAGGKKVYASNFQEAKIQVNNLLLLKNSSSICWVEIRTTDKKKYKHHSSYETICIKKKVVKR